MKSGILLKEKLKSSGVIILVGFCFGLVYWIFGDEWTDPAALINAVTIGLTGGIVLSFFEYFVFRIDSRRWNFLSIVLIKTILYLFLFALLIIGFTCLTRSITSNRGFWEYFYSEQFQHFIFQEDFHIILIYCLIVLVIINFTRQINRKIGHGVLLNFIFGRYHEPREEARIFAFIDLKQSTRIAEQLRALQFHKLLYEFFHDISLSILLTKGQIYRYVGDEIVVSWKMQAGLNNANCLRCFFLMKQQIIKNRSKYLKLFGLTPDFHAAFHAGTVVRGEIGDVKSQLVYHGETMFIGSKMEKTCSKLGYELLISSTLLEKISLPKELIAKKIGKMKGNGEVELYTIYEKRKATSEDPSLSMQE
jgi:adenylate cyclase